MCHLMDMSSWAQNHKSLLDQIYLNYMLWSYIAVGITSYPRTSTEKLHPTDLRKYNASLTMHMRKHCIFTCTGALTVEKAGRSHFTFFPHARITFMLVIT